MPPVKHATTSKTRHSIRLGTDLPEARPSLVVENPPVPHQQILEGGETEGGRGMIQLDVQALTRTIFVAVAQTIKEA